MRRFVVGDIHANLKSLKEVFKKVKFDHDKDFLIILGDVVDGYNDSYQVVEELIKVKNKVLIIGNHDQFFMNHMANGWAEDVWLRQGGVATRESYKSNGWMYSKFPDTHKEFFNSGVFWHEMDGMLFVHGGFEYPTHPKDTKNVDILTWDRSLIERAKNGLKMREWKKVFVGHTCLSKDSVVISSSGISFLESKPSKVYGIEDMKVTENKITEYYHKKKKVIEIYANNIIEATKEHRLPILHNNRIVFQKVSRLNVGDLLLSPKKISIKGSLQKLNWIKPVTKNFHSIAAPNMLDKEVSYLLGVILGDGSVGERSIEISERYKKNMDMISNLFEEKFNVKSNVFKREDKNAYRVRVHSTELAENLDIKHNKKYFLELIGKSPSNIRMAFLSGLIDTDGCLGREITFSQKDKRVIDFVHSILLTEGIHSIIRKNKNTSSYNKDNPTFCYELRIRAEHNEKLCELLKTKYKGKTEFSKYIDRKVMNRFKCYGDFVLYPIKKMVPLDKTIDVIDISVEKCETFIANGICSHNSTENTTADVITYQKFKTGSKLIQVDCGAGWKGRLCLYNIDTDEYVLSKYADRKLEEFKNKQLVS